ncbi:MAG: DegT/DnrJ/EryC1/StrS family aminotransferase [Winogradskyella sp.]|nr:DegT/DnrJ/EryC1/StrS family aminotransferase [Winogradskyella sp.]
MVKYLDLHKLNARFEAAFKAEFNDLIIESQYILGNKVITFETEFAQYCGASHCLGVGNGLDALTLILKGYVHLGKLNPGDHVIVPANTFIATILSVIHAGLKPILVEPSLQTYNLTAEGIKSHLNEQVKAIIIVHLYGQLADLDIETLAKTNNLLLIEDAAQAHGAKNRDNTMAGAIGDAAAFSFYPSKNLGALADGGAVTTNDKELFNRVALLRNYGSQKKYVNEIIGVNSRLDNLQAGILSIKLKQLDNDNEKRRTIAQRYLKQISNDNIILPFVEVLQAHVFYAFVVRVENREAFMSYLEKHHVGFVIHYPIAPHQQNALKDFNSMHLPITETIHNTCISIPLNPIMSDEEVTYVINTLNRY